MAIAAVLGPVATRGRLAAGTSALAPRRPSVLIAVSGSLKLYCNDTSDLAIQGFVALLKRLRELAAADPRLAPAGGPSGPEGDRVVDLQKFARTCTGS